MTDQTNLDLLWASTGGVTDPGDAIYQLGWEVEIPTYQKFNFILQNLNKNILHFAEEDLFDYEPLINYGPGAKVLGSNGVTYTCKVPTSGNDPVLDTAFDFWVTGSLTGGNVSDYANLLQQEGQKVIMPTRATNNWTGQDRTTINNIPMTVFRTTGATNNWGFGNMQGEVCVMNLGQDQTPDSRTLSKGGGNTYRVFHEGHKPTVEETPGAVEEAPNDGDLYARKGIDAENGDWIRVTTTVVQDAPPPPSIGSGTGWYNLGDGHFYVDINDGSSSQWVLANPPQVPNAAAEDVSFTPGASSLSSTDTQAVILELLARIEALEA